MLRHCFYIVGFLSLLVILQSCNKGDKIEKSVRLPNILFIVSEAHGQDLICYDNDVVKTPNIDCLACNGVKFDKVYTTYSVCSQSINSIFTDLSPYQNGQMGLVTLKFRMYKSFGTIPRYLKNTRYRTSYLGKIHVNQESVIPSGFHELTDSNFITVIRKIQFFSGIILNISEVMF